LWNSRTFKEELNKLNKTKKYLVYCRSGHRSGASVDVMKELGFIEIYNLEDGIIKWKEKGFPVVASTPVPLQNYFTATLIT
jgi:rhodanese-related sulfurtransferase